MLLLEENLAKVNHEAEVQEHLTRSDDFPTVSTPTRVSTGMGLPNLSPIVGQELEFTLLPRIANIPPWLKKKTEKAWTQKPLLEVKYVDDGINAEVINMKECPLMLLGEEKFKETHAHDTAQLLEHIRLNAESKGMKVNEKKTALMCVSAARSYDARVKLNFNGQTVTGRDSLKILGVTLDKDCSFTSHVNNLSKKLRKKTWALTRLRKKGMSEDDLVQAYKTLIRPTAEYASPVWHSLITVGESEFLERQQTQALRNIYGTALSARRMRLKSDLERLWTRREEACRKFAQKNVTNPRCNGWFIPRQPPRYARRASTSYNEYYEPLSRTDRHRNSPINYARRLLNRAN